MTFRDRVVAGIMSGTSADGIDIALLRIKGRHTSTLIGGGEYPFEPNLRSHILSCAEPSGGNSRQVAELHFRLAAAYDVALQRVLAAASLVADDLDLIGCHGQTIAHWPIAEHPSTLQAGSGPALAALTGVPVVHDFRAADVALGGQGAPLIPWVDWVLFNAAAAHQPIGILNLGGIGNITLLPAGCSSSSELLAFDTGPANMLIDGLARELLNAPFDRDGHVAAQGTVDLVLLEELLAHPFFSRPLPRSAGREDFGGTTVAAIIANGTARGLSAADILATATAFSAQSIADAVLAAPMRLRPTTIVLGGGGAANPTLIGMLAERLPDVSLLRHEDFGWPSGLKEAVGFALLADAAVRAEPTALPQVTGTTTAHVLGSIAPGRPPRAWPDWIVTR